MKNKIRLLKVGEEIKILLGKKKIPKDHKVFFAKGSKKTNFAKHFEFIYKNEDKMLVIEQHRNENNGGYYAFISSFLKGNKEIYYIDSAYAFDKKLYKTMIFKCEDIDNYKQSINWKELYVENYVSLEDMLERHNKILAMSANEFKNLLNQK